MNKRYVNESYDIVVFLDTFDRLVDWHYNADDGAFDEEYWNKETQPDGGNAEVYAGAERYVDAGGDQTPDIYIVPTEDAETHVEGPPILLIDWPIREKGWKKWTEPIHIYSVHMTNDGELDPPLPKALARRLTGALCG